MYHLPCFILGPKDRGRIEGFNYLHFSLRNSIERSFGCCKARWNILGNMSHFQLKTTTHVILAYMTLHNFIRRNDISDGEFLLFNENVELDYDVEID